MRSGKKKILIVKILLLSSLALQCYTLLNVYKSIATLTPDLFEMFRPLGHLYFLAGIMLVASIMMSAIRETTKETDFNLIVIALTCLILYKLLPKYVYFLPLQREIYHTANIMYVYKYHSINVPGYPSMPDSVGYAIFYAVLGLVMGLDGQNFIDFLAVFTDLFHLLVILIISIVVVKHYTGFQGIKLFYILSMPIVFMLQIDTTYRNGFGTLLFVYTIALLNMFSVKVDGKLLILLSFALLASAVSYPGLIPLFTIGMLFLLMICVLHYLFITKLIVGINREGEVRRVRSVFLLLLVGNVAWFIWQIARYPKFFNMIKMYVDSLIELFLGHVEIEAFTARTVVYNNVYNLLLMLRAVYAIILLAFISLLALAVLFRIKKEKENAMLSASLALGFAIMILLGAKGNFHFGAIYNIFSSSSAILLSSLLSSNTFNNFVQRVKSRGRTSNALQMLFVIAFCSLILLSPINLWPAFKNLMPIEAREIEMFKILARYIVENAEIDYLSLYGDTMGTAIQYVFADRIDITIRGMPYPIDTPPHAMGLLVCSNSVISFESKIKFIEPLHIWFTNFLTKLYVKEMYSKILDLGYNHEALLKSS